MSFGTDSRLRNNLRQFVADEGSASLTQKVGDWVPVLEELQEIVSPTDARHLGRILSTIRDCHAETMNKANES